MKRQNINSQINPNQAQAHMPEDNPPSADDGINSYPIWLIYLFKF